jgi:hypothetical protein
MRNVVGRLRKVFREVKLDGNLRLIRKFYADVLVQEILDCVGNVFSAVKFGNDLRGVIHNLWLSESLPIRDQFDDELSFGSDPFRGVIAHLIDKYGGNVHDHGVVAITGVSQFGRDYTLKNAADLTSQSGFFSCGGPNRWLCHNFKKVKIKSRHYSIRSCCGSWGYLLKSWVVERSNDGKSWIELDRRDSQSQAARCCITKTFAISRSEPVRIIRLRQIAEHQ